MLSVNQGMKRSTSADISFLDARKYPRKVISVMLIMLCSAFRKTIPLPDQTVLGTDALPPSQIDAGSAARQRRVDAARDDVGISRESKAG